MYELTQSQVEQDLQLPILNLFEICLDIGEHFTHED
jgi:glutathionylspermidine synthase